MEKEVAGSIDLQPLLNEIAKAWIANPDAGFEVLESLRRAYEWRVEHGTGDKRAWTEVLANLETIRKELHGLTPQLKKRVFDQVKFTGLLAGKIKRLQSDMPQKAVTSRIYFALLTALFAKIENNSEAKDRRAELFELGSRLSFR